MTGADLFAWYGIGFVAVFAVGLVLLVVGLLGLGHDGTDSAGAGHDAGADAEHGGAGTLHADVHGHSVILDFLGVGRCPLSIVLMVLCFLFALAGVSAVVVLRAFHLPSLVVGLGAYAAGLFGGFLLTGRVARLVGRILPSTETYVETEAAHVGALGSAVYGFEDGRGFVQVRDKTGTVHELRAVVSEPGPPIAAGDAVLVLEYEPGSRTFKVQPAPPELSLKRE